MAIHTDSNPWKSSFNGGSLDGWTERSFSGNTHYELVEDNGVSVLKGYTQGQASLLYREQVIDVSSHPILRWSWKIDRTFQDLDEKSESGDDFPARLYVVVKTGFLPWESVVINYVWSSNTPIHETWVNPFSDKSRMLVVQSGNSRVGQWVEQQRDVAQDFKLLFDLNVDEIHGYAVMVDGDNAGNEATAWFSHISFGQ